MNLPSVLFLPAFLVLAATSQAAIVIIDSGTLNGSFETGTGNNTITAWTAAPGHFLERINNNANQGSWSLVIGRNAAGTSVSGAAISTTHTITTGTTFELSYSLKGAFGAEATDAVNWSLFYTSDDTLSGTVTVLASGGNLLTGATGVIATSPYSSSGVMISPAADALANGHTLFLSFTPGAGFTNDEFARLDSVSLVANVPEPGAPALSLLAVAALVLRRRR